MQLSSGNPNLVSLTRYLVGDYEGQDRRLLEPQEVEDAINAVYPEVVTNMKWLQSGVPIETSTTTIAAAVSEISAPSDMVELLMVETSATTNFATATVPPAAGNDIQIHEITEARLFLERFWKGELGAWGSASPSDYIAATLGDKILVAPHTASGGATKYARITYSGEPAALTSESSEPVIPSSFHPLICFRAAILLRAGLDLPVDVLSAQLQKREEELGMISDKGSSPRS